MMILPWLALAPMFLILAGAIWWTARNEPDLLKVAVLFVGTVLTLLAALVAFIWGVTTLRESRTAAPQPLTAERQ